MRTLKQVNEYYSSTGYSVERVNGYVMVSFEGNHVWTFAKGITVVQVVEAMSEMHWLAWGNNSCELPVAVKPLTIKERAALKALANREAEERLQREWLYTDDQFRRNGYGHYDCCELPTTEETTIQPEAPVITKSQALELGFCFQYYTNDILVYRPDGSSFYATSTEQALSWISDGTHLCAYNEPPHCDNNITPVLSGTVPSPVSYWLEADTRPLTQMAQETLSLLSQGYDPDEHWLDLKTGNIFTLDGDVLVGTTSEQRW